VKTIEHQGLVSRHVYTVVAYDAAQDRVRLRNPWRRNPSIPPDNQHFLGENDPENPQHVNNGYFWMNLGEFTRRFMQIAYEEE
jgi:hypothetical protein